MRSLVFALLAALICVACGAPPVGVGDGGVADAAIEVCLEPDRVCPTLEPFPGSPCEGMLHCDYAAGIGTCVAGEWTWDPGCDGGPGGCAPPLVETCSTPFAGTLSSATVELGPDESGAFRPFAPGEHVRPVYGSQGGAMVAYRLRVSSPSGTPTCVEALSRLGYDRMPVESLTSSVELHCGQTLRIYSVLPDRPCEMRPYPLELEVSVTGAGVTSASLVIDGQPCPR